MLNVRYEPASLRQIKRLKRKHYDMDRLLDAVEAIATRNGDLLSTRYRDHALTGNLAGFRELHIQSDWLLVYKIKNDTLTLLLVATGTHDSLL